MTLEEIAVVVITRLKPKRPSIEKLANMSPVEALEHGFMLLADAAAREALQINRVVESKLSKADKIRRLHARMKNDPGIPKHRRGSLIAKQADCSYQYVYNVLGRDM